MKMRFKDLPIGARFKYPDGDDVWVVIETHHDGLIVRWLGLHPEQRQDYCCFVDDDWSLESEVEVVMDTDEGETEMCARIKQNDDEQETELWLDGTFHASWEQFDIPEKSIGRLEAMLNYAIDHGKQLKAAEIRKVLGVDND